MQESKETVEIAVFFINLVRDPQPNKSLLLHRSEVRCLGLKFRYLKQRKYQFMSNSQHLI